MLWLQYTSTVCMCSHTDRTPVVSHVRIEDYLSRFSPVTLIEVYGVRMTRLYTCTNVIFTYTLVNGLSGVLCDVLSIIFSSRHLKQPHP